jgi:ATP-dependent RNA helicase RhlE
MSFSNLKLNPNLLKALTELGYDQPTPIQLGTIEPILKQQDIMARAQTGTGKTAAFALPILHRLAENEDLGENRPIRALVLTPTRELAQQVYKNFEGYGKYTELKSAIAYGGVSINPQITALKEGADVLVATPGRLLDHLTNETVTLDKLQFLVFDEADRMLDMGFMDEISRVLKLVPKQRQTLMFSATFDEAILKLGKTLLNDPQLIEVDATNTAAEKVKQVIYAVDKDRKREMISHMIGAKNWHQVLIFVRTKQGADALAKEMGKDGIKAVSIHGDKSQGAREKALEDFKKGTIRALVATDVASRGLDIRQLNYVINYELPYNAEDYIHRIGRTGRAGENGLAISLISPDENYLLEEVEKVLDEKLVAQWMPGYEPDLTKDTSGGRPKSKAQAKQRNHKGSGRAAGSSGRRRR